MAKPIDRSTSLRQRIRELGALVGTGKADVPDAVLKTRIRNAQRELAAIERAKPAPAAPAAKPPIAEPTGQWVATRSFRCGEKLIRHGAVISAADLAGMRNARQMIDAKFIIWVPAGSAPRPSLRPKAAAAQPEPVKIVSFTEQLRREMRRLFDQGLGVDAVHDRLIQMPIYERALHEFAEANHKATGRATTDHFIEHLRQLPPTQEKAA